MAPQGADDAELELTLNDMVDDALRVEDGEGDDDGAMLLAETAQHQRHQVRARAPWTPRSQAFRAAPAGLARQLVDQLALRMQQALRPSVEDPAGLGRLHAAARAVEQPLPEPLLERPHLQADRRLCDAEAVCLREAVALDNGAERGELARVHKQSLWMKRACERIVNPHWRCAGRAIVPRWVVSLHCSPPRVRSARASPVRRPRRRRHTESSA